jgi:cytochrome b6-f complex iron-sulfur subunit
MSTQKKEEKITRRSFLKTLWGVIGGVVALEFAGVTLAYMQPRLAEGEFGGLIDVGMVDTFPPGSVTHISNGRFFLSRLADGGFLAIYQRCTHLGCSVPWDQVEGKFICPCHNSQFTPDGELINPPAPRPLDIFPVIIEDDLVKVDTSSAVQRAGFDSSQLVYA